MDDSRMIEALLRDRFDAIERRLDQQRGAIEMAADAQNRLTASVYKQNERMGKLHGRLDKVEDWIKRYRHRVERREDAVHHHRNRVATILSGLIGALATWGLVALTGMH